MRKVNWPSIYAYIICLVMLIAFIFAGSQMIRSALNLALPDNTPYAEKISMKPGFNPQVTPEAEQFYKEKQQEFYYKNNLKGVISGFFMLLVIVPVYLYHWRLGGKYRTYEGGVLTVRDFYFYMASLVTLLVGVITLLSVINTLVPYLMGTYSYLPSIESIPYNLGKTDPGSVTITKEMVQKSLEQARQNSYFPRESLIRQLTMVLVTIPLYFLHWHTTKSLHKV